MFLQNLRAKVGARLSGDSEAGFTLIELLVVMLILGILAAIALPAFFNQKEKAGDAKAKEYAHTAQVAMETYSTENGGSYAGATVAKLENIEPTIRSIHFANTNEEANITPAPSCVRLHHLGRRQQIHAERSLWSNNNGDADVPLYGKRTWRLPVKRKAGKTANPA